MRKSVSRPSVMCCHAKQLAKLGHPLAEAPQDVDPADAMAVDAEVHLLSEKLAEAHLDEAVVPVGTAPKVQRADIGTSVFDRAQEVRPLMITTQDLDHLQAPPLRA